MKFKLLELLEMFIQVKIGTSMDHIVLDAVQAENRYLPLPETFGWLPTS